MANKPQVLIDSNIIIDIFNYDPIWYDWSSLQVLHLSKTHDLIINPIIYAEISYRFTNIEALDKALSTGFMRLPIPFEAAFLAAKCHKLYRDRGGKRIATLPDFFIGAHAAITGMALLTRDGTRYRNYLPRLKLICPEIS